jgi:DUF4097 and DUF4098 domain-containing protein YvlB
MLKNLFIPFFLLSLIAQSAFSEVFRHEIIHEWSAGQFETATLAVGSARIEAEGTASPVLRMTIAIEMEAKDQERAREAFDRVKVIISEEDGLKVEIKEAKKSFSWLFFWRKSPRITVSAQVPENQEMNFVTGSGDIDLVRIAGKLSCVAGSGTVRSDNSTGSLKAVTGAGNVQITNHSGSFSAATGAGDVRLQGPVDSFNIATGAGDVEIRSSTKAFQASSVFTGAGHIVAYLDPGAIFELQAEVGFGDISCEFPLSDMVAEKKKLTGRTGEGAQSLRLNTGFGDVHVLRN